MHCVVGSWHGYAQVHMTTQEHIADLILRYHPAVQAIYLFGTHGTDYERPDSDVDIAVLLPPVEAKAVGSLALSPLQFALEDALEKPVDLINLRQVPTVFQKAIIMDERRFFCADRYAAEEFEMLVLSFYLKLNEERAEILAEGLRSGRFYDV